MTVDRASRVVLSPDGLPGVRDAAARAVSR